MEILWIIFYFACGFLFRDALLFRKTEIEHHETNKKEPRRALIEKLDDVYFAYDRDTDKFLGQGFDITQLVKELVGNEPAIIIESADKEIIEALRSSLQQHGNQ